MRSNIYFSLESYPDCPQYYNKYLKVTNACEVGSIPVNVIKSLHLRNICLVIFSASFMTKTVPCGNELHKFLIWDTAGQERVSIMLIYFYLHTDDAVQMI